LMAPISGAINESLLWDRGPGIRGPGSGIR